MFTLAKTIGRTRRTLHTRDVTRQAAGCGPRDGADDGPPLRLGRSVWRMFSLALWPWRLILPLMLSSRRHRRRLPSFRGADGRRTIRQRRPAQPALPADRPWRQATRALRIVQMAGIVENGDWLVSICRDLRAKGGDVMAVVGSPEGSVARRLREAGVPYFSLPLSFAPSRGRIGRLLVYAVRLPGTIVRLARFFRRERVDVVHTHVFNTIIIGRLAAWLARVPCRVSMVTGPLHLEAPFTRWADRLTWWMDHQVIAGSSWTRDRYRALGMTERRLACVSYGANAARFDPARADGERVRHELGIAPGVPLIGLVAYFYPPRDDWQTPPAIRGRGIKGHDDFIYAARADSPADAGRALRARRRGVGRDGRTLSAEPDRTLPRREDSTMRCVFLDQPRRRAGHPRRARRRGAMFVERELRRHHRSAADGAADRGDARGRHAGNDPSRRNRPAGAAARSRGAGRGDPRAARRSSLAPWRWGAPAAR